LLEKTGSRTVSNVIEGGAIEALERRIDQLRGALRRAAGTGDRARARALRAELRQAEHAWDDAVTDLEHRATEHRATEHRTTEHRATGERETVPKLAGSMLSIREQVHHALTLLTVPAAPKLITAVHEAFFPGELVAARLTSLRRDEERSFRVAPFGRPYYLGPALTADLLAPARGLLAISTWPMEKRVVGPLSPRVDFLISAMKVAARIAGLPSDEGPARRLLWRFAASIPGGSGANVQPDTVIEAAKAELEVHAEADAAHRAAAAERARDRLDEAERLFGARLRKVRDRETLPH
jgi:hypothetical protein